MSQNIDVNELFAEEDKAAKMAAEKAAEKNNKGGEADLTKYLNLNPEPGQKSKTTSIRILPGSATSSNPFIPILCHDLTVVPSPRFANSKHKTVLCPHVKDYEGNEEKCPICEASKFYWGQVNDLEKKQKEMKKNGEDTKAIDDEIEKLSKTASGYRQRQYFVVRVIERGKESEGVKFWRFPNNLKGEGFKDTIMTIARTTYNKKDEEGNIKQENIFDVEEGYDLDITVDFSTNAKGNPTKNTTIQKGDKRPLSKDKALADQWINDPTTWKDVYAVKSYDWLSAVLRSGGRAPIWDGDNNRYVPNLTGGVSSVGTAAPAAPAKAPAAPAPAPAPAKAKVEEPKAAEAAEGEEDTSDLPF